MIPNKRDELGKSIQALNNINIDDKNHMPLWPRVAIIALTILLEIAWDIGSIDDKTPPS